MRRQLEKLYARLQAHYGPTHWWPGDSPFEIAVGAILTQNTAWTNVEKAIANLKRERLLSVEAVLRCPNGRLEEALRPSGYFRLKAVRVRAFCQYLADRYEGRMECMAERPLDDLRAELLAVHGIGPETADDILLYACEKPVFVVDAYTRRILRRHGLMVEPQGYETVRELFEKHLPRDVALFKEYHGLIVFAGKDYCRRTPRCAECPLACLLRNGRPVPD